VLSYVQDSRRVSILEVIIAETRNGNRQSLR